MLVNGLPLPEYLIELLERGRWKRPTDLSALATLFATHDSDFSFLQPDAMERETRSGFEIMNTMGEAHALEVYGIASSKRSGAAISDPTILDLDQAVLIALNWSENTICLDYRSGTENPCVVIAVYGKPTRWKQIAPDIKAFAEFIGL